MSDLLDIRCPQCDRLYQLTAAHVGPKGRKMRCSACHFVFEFVPQPPPPPPMVNPVGGKTMLGGGTVVSHIFPTAPKWTQRTHLREELHTRALLRLLPSGIEVHGITQDVSSSGAYLLTNNPPSHEKSLKTGVSGIFELILLEGNQPAFIEMLSRVVRLDEEGVGIQFVPENELPKIPNLSMPMSPFTPRPYAKVYVRRSSGTLEEGWQILPNSALLPPTINRLYQERRQQCLAVVCRKKTAAGEGFKIYSVKELREIQQEAEQLGQSGP